MDCAANCGTTIVPEKHVNGYYTALAGKLIFCTLTCIESWLPTRSERV